MRDARRDRFGYAPQVPMSVRYEAGRVEPVRRETGQVPQVCQIRPGAGESRRPSCVAPACPANQTASGCVGTAPEVRRPGASGCCTKQARRAGQARQVRRAGRPRRIRQARHRFRPRTVIPGGDGPSACRPRWFVCRSGAETTTGRRAAVAGNGYRAAVEVGQQDRRAARPADPTRGRRAATAIR